MANQIVTVTVSQQIAPTPSTLQRTGALISQGATTTAQNALSYLTQMSDLTPLLAGTHTNATLTWASTGGGTVTVTTTAAHGFTISDSLWLTIAGVTATGYNGSYLCTITGTSTFTYLLAANPGTATVPGVYSIEDIAELTQMATTYFAQGAQNGVYVLELGAGGPTDGVATLTTWLTNNPLTVYAFLVPREWDANSNFLTLIQSYESPTGLTYFWVTTTTGTYTSYTALMKCVNALIESPTKTAGEFSQAAAFWRAIGYAPSSSNKVTPFGFGFMFGVTPYPTSGNQSLLATLNTANISVIGTGSQGGISDAILLWGKMLDGNPYNYWYSVDFAQINLALSLTNAIINGSNNPANPLYLDQQGITQLEGVAAGVMTTMITVGLALGQIVQVALDGPTFALNLANGVYAGRAAINAVPFAIYYIINPGDYKIGNYSGFTVTYTPLRGFQTITINVIVTQFVAAAG